MGVGRDHRARRRGVTVSELIVAVSLMAVFTAAMAPLLHAVQRSWATKEGDCESLANARAFIHHFRHHLSQALSVTVVSDPQATDAYLQFITSDGNEVRYETDAQGDIRFGPPGALSELAGPVGALRFTCYDANDLSTPIADVNSIDLVRVDAVFRNPSGQGRNHALSTCVHIRARVGRETYGGQPGVALKRQIDWAGPAAVIDSYRFSLGGYDPTRPGSAAVVSVNATGPGVIALSAGALLRGGAYVGPGGDPEAGISLIGGARITRMQGTLARPVDIPDLSDPIGPPFDGPPEGNFQYSAGTCVINSDRHFNKMSLTGVSKTIIHGDVTILVDDDLRVEDAAELKLQPPASLRLYVGKDATFKDAVIVNSLMQEPSAVRVYMLGSGKTLRMEGASRMWAVIQNPNGDIEITGDAELYGKIKADRLTGVGRIHADLDSTFE